MSFAERKRLFNVPRYEPQDVEPANDARAVSEMDHGLVAHRSGIELDAHGFASINVAERETSTMLAEAQAYRERVVREAQGEAERFSAVYAEYRSAPQVTRDRLYIETMERVYQQGNLIILDQRGGSVPYLPLDSMIRRPATAQGGGGGQ